MNQYSKENAFNRVVRNLENEPGIFNIEKEKGMDFNLTCILYNKVKLIFNLPKFISKKTDLLQSVIDT